MYIRLPIESTPKLSNPPHSCAIKSNLIQSNLTILFEMFNPYMSN